MTAWLALVLACGTPTEPEASWMTEGQVLFVEGGVVVLQHDTTEGRVTPTTLPYRVTRPEQVAGLVRDRHVRDHELNRLMARDWDPERLPLLGISDRFIERSAHDAAGERPDVGSRAVERLHRDLEPLAFGTEQVRRGDDDVF